MSKTIESEKMLFPYCKVPNCGGILLIERINDNFSIDYKCSKNDKHYGKNIYFKTFERFYLIENKIDKCLQCYKYFNIINNEYQHKCKECEKNYCSSCFIKHIHNINNNNNDKLIINKKLCKIHNQQLIYYCHECNNFLCESCKMDKNFETEKHIIKNLSDIIPTKNKINNLPNKLRAYDEIIKSIDDWKETLLKKIEHLKENLLNEKNFINKMTSNFDFDFDLTDYSYYLNFDYLYNYENKIYNNFIKNAFTFDKKTEFIIQYFYNVKKCKEEENIEYYYLDMERTHKFDSIDFSEDIIDVDSDYEINLFTFDKDLHSINKIDNSKNFSNNEKSPLSNNNKKIIKINDNEYEIIDNRYIKLHFEKTFNNEKRKIKVIQVIPHEFQFYSYYDLNLNHNNVLTKYIISHDDNIKIDDITNEYFKRNESLNLIYFEGKTTNEMIVKPGSVFFSKKILYSIYNYIPEFKSKEDNIIKMKESNNKIAVNILARYKKVIITNYGQEVEDIYKIKISNYETKVYSVNINYPLILNKRYEVDLVELNGQKVEYSAEDSSITILKFGAFNNQFAEVHFKYKYFNDDKDIFREETIITNNVKNSYCKLIIEIPEENVVISTNDIYSKNENKNNEYIFDGISKEDELTEIIHFSNKKAEWDIQKEITLQSKESIENCTFKVNRMFKGGNLKVESYEISKDNSEFIDDEEKDKFIFKYNKLNVNKVSIGLKLKVKNSTADYNFDGNEELLIKIPEEDKQFFKDLSDKILNEDNSNFPNYKKLGKWVYNYMTYNLLLRGRNMTAREIYNKKIGVCEHFTLLYNTLLVSQGIKAIKISGFALNRNKNQQNKEQNTLKDNRHCWTLALIDGVWVPLDATWNLFEKKLPLSHIFQNYGNCNFLTTSDIKNNVTNEVTKEIIKQTEN